MVQHRKPVQVDTERSTFGGNGLLTILALIYIAVATLSAVNIIIHAQNSTTAIEGLLDRYSLKNEGSKALDAYEKEHPFLGFFFGSPVRQELELPSSDEANQALSSEVKGLLKTIRHESFIVAWWSWSLLSLSLLYAVGIMALNRALGTRSVIFALTTISVFCFVIGIFAPAMVIWTAPSIPLESGTLQFVVQHEVRGIAAIIWELLKSGHWIIGGFLLLFSILTPLTKATLTYFVTASKSKELNFKIGEFLHTIGKWSMADVFVAAILLSLYALKFQEATKSIPCIGLYYFIGYCLLSLSTTELLVRSGLVSGNETKARGKMTGGVIVGLFAAVVCFMAASSLYTYQQYTANTKHEVKDAESPGKLDNSNLVLPVHK